jgi:predicted enzyme related to lactoylglutathione lyase
MAHLPGKFVWFEHYSSAPGAAESFYCSLFRWTVKPMDMGGGGAPYRMLMNGQQGVGGVLPAQHARARSAWMSYLSVADVDASAAAAKAAGATVVMPPTDFGGVGRGATLVDPTGATVSIWNSTEGDPPDVELAPVGAWYWNELWTGDEPKAREFYGRAFGFTFDGVDMGPGGMYYMLMKDGQARGGIARSARKGALSLWLPYVRVENCDASQARAGELGAKVLVPATDIPGTGRFAIVEDPTGAAVAFIHRA